MKALAVIMRLRKRWRAFKLKLITNATILKLRTSYSKQNYSKLYPHKLKSSKSNDKRCRRCYTHSKQIINKGVIPYLCIANHLLERTPMYTPNDYSCHAKHKTSTASDFDLSNQVFDTDDPIPNSVPIAFPASEKKTKVHDFDTDSFRIGIDTCASRCMSFVITDFVQSSLRPCTSAGGVRQFGKGPRLQISHIGTVKWRIQDDEGRTHMVLIPNSFLVPQGSSRLLSPQHWSKEAYRQGDESPDTTHSVQYHNRNVLIFGNKGQFKCTVYNDPAANVPYFSTATGCKDYNRYVKRVEKVHHKKITALETVMCYPTMDIVANEAATGGSDEPNYSPSNHIFTEENISDFVESAGNPNVDLLSEEEEHTAATTDRGELLRWHHRLGHISFQRLQGLAKANVIPSRLAKVKPPKCVACIYGKMHRTPWRTKGVQRSIRVATKPGECVSVDQMQSSCMGFVGQLKGRLTNKRYKYATVFVDHCTRYKYVYLQAALTSSETLEAKRAFEAHARNNGVTVLNYHADNGRFADNAFINDSAQQGQIISYCGVNAHWQNGIAEKAIRDLRENARTSLLHAIQRWPSSINVHLWPYALRYAMEVSNNMPAKDGGPSPRERFSQVEIMSNMRNFHTFGCPVYALDRRLQEQKSVNSWAPRARLGINLGPSPRHARSVTLVMNLSNGLVSPQYHVRHDEFFETVDRNTDSPKAPWMTLAGFRNQRVTREVRMEPVGQRTATRSPQLSPDDSTQPLTSRNTLSSMIPELEAGIANDMVQGSNAQPPQSDVYRTRSGRESRAPERFDPTGYSAYYEVLHEEDFQIQDDMCDPIAFKASSDPDTLYYHEAMAAPDRKQFLEAIVKEVNAHIENNHWALVPKRDVPKDAKVLDAVWSMKRKRDIKTQQVYKYKARLNIHGGQQEYGVHYTETYSPVVNWFSVRLLLVMAIINKWHTRQVDFVLAYPQAPIPYDNYMKLPHGIKTTQGDGCTHVLKLIQNIYGGRNSGRVWNEYLHNGLKNIGFVQSQVDECVYYRGKCIFLCYVDDGIFNAISKSLIK